MKKDRFVVEIVPPHVDIQAVLNQGKPGYEFRQYVLVQQRDHGPYREITWERR